MYACVYVCVEEEECVCLEGRCICVCLEGRGMSGGERCVSGRA